MADYLDELTMAFEFEFKAMGFDTSKNEFETMELFVKHPRLHDRARVEWDMVMEKNNLTFNTSESINLREHGNKLFKDSPEKNALDACRLYTKAIFAAPPASEALALAHANRAMALQKYGYFQQAYDDCECALEQGYPINLRHKIYARQAACAEKLGEATLLRKHLDSLTALPLNKTYTAQVEELQHGLEKLKINERNSEKNEQHNEEYRAALRITKTTTKGRCLIAEKSMTKDELIFIERATSFIPASDRHICQHCAATQLIPFPCYKCYGKVVYCSLKCRVAHQAIHEYECLSYQKGLFNKYYHLALRMVLDEVPDVISFLRQKRTAKDIWNELTCENSRLLQSNCQYTQSLSMITHLEKKDLAGIFHFANLANLMNWYLQNKTTFFDLFKTTKASLKDWQLAIASLLLRHICQLDVNGNTIAVLCIKIADPFDSTLLVNKLWQSPFHVRRGFLHMFCDYEDLIVANYPHYYSVCNNVCFKSIVSKSNGRYLSAFAVNDIKAGAEISNLYTLGYLNTRRSQRQSYLMEKFHFECKCVKCSNENPDEEFEKLHRFRCEECCQIFIGEPDVIITHYKCTKCNAIQHKLYENLKILGKLIFAKNLNVCFLESLLVDGIKAYENLDQWLLGPHDIKYEISILLVTKCFEVGDIAFFNFFNFSRIIEILKFHLRCKIERYHLKTIDYVGPMTYLWDFIALGKYQCTAAEMQEMLKAIEILPDETRKLFINYYNDHIVGNIK